MERIVGLVTIVCMSCSPGPAGPASSAPPGHHGQGFHHGFKDAATWATVFDDPARDAWQKPEAVIDLFALGSASKVADVGAGTGYFAVRIARRVPDGRVYAVDIEPDMVRHLGERSAREHLAQITPVLATGGDAKIPEPVDVVLIVDTLHHIDDRPRYLAKLRNALKEGGRLFIVDFKLDAAMGPPKEHRLAPEAVVKDAEDAGLQALPVTLELPEQYVLCFQR